MLYFFICLSNSCPCKKLIFCQCFHKVKRFDIRTIHHFYQSYFGKLGEPHWLCQRKKARQVPTILGLLKIALVDEINPCLICMSFLKAVTPSTWSYKLNWSVKSSNLTTKKKALGGKADTPSTWSDILNWSGTSSNLTTKKKALGGKVDTPSTWSYKINWSGTRSSPTTKKKSLGGKAGALST